MATNPTPDPSQAGGSPQGGSAGAPSQAPAPPEIMMLSRISQAIQQLASSRPEVASGAQKAIQGINEMQSSIVTGPQQQSPQQSPPQ